MAIKTQVCRPIIALLCVVCVWGCRGDGEVCECDAECDSECEASCEDADTDVVADVDDAFDVEAEPPVVDDVEALRRVIEARRSFRDFTDDPVTSDDIADLVWSAQGITLPSVGFRASPSAGVTYPLEVYVAADKVEGMDPGLYWYSPDMNRLVPTSLVGPLASRIATAALGQSALQRAAAIIVFAAVFDRTTDRYAERGIMYVHMEAGHAAENLLLMATARGLGSVPIGAFYPDRMTTALDLPPDHEPIYIIAVGHKP